jgi:hypothetical protein
MVRRKDSNSEKMLSYPTVSWPAYLILVVGVVTIVCFIPTIASLAEPPDPMKGLPNPPSYNWLPQVIGTRVNLPKVDCQGYEIPHKRTMPLITLACNMCSTFDSIRSKLLQSALHPVIICVNKTSQEIMETFGHMPDRFLILVVTEGEATVPEDLLKYAPQAALLDHSARIVKVPSENQTMEEFLATIE